MRAKRVTPTAERDALAIAAFIRRDNTAAADRYFEAAISTFMNWSDDVVPRRASPHLPEHIREFAVTGFRGYTLRMATIDETVYLLAAFAPGLPDDVKDSHTLATIRSL